MSMTQVVVHISDRFMNPDYPDCIDRQERLVSCTLLVSLCYLMLSIALVSLSHIFTAAANRQPQAPNVFIELLRVKPVVVQPAVVPQPSFTSGKPNLGGNEAKPDPKAKQSLRTGARESAHQGPATTSRQSTLPIESPVNAVAAKPNPAEQPNAVTEPRQARNTESQNKQDEPDRTANSPRDGEERTISGSATPGTSQSTAVGPGDSDAAAGGERVSAKLPPSMVKHKGNIVPYRDALVSKLSATWHPLKRNETALVQLVIAQDGQLVSAQIIQSKGPKYNQNIMEAISNTQFDPLPAWYKGESLSFVVSLNAVDIDR